MITVGQAAFVLGHKFEQDFASDVITCKACGAETNRRRLAYESRKELARLGPCRPLYRRIPGTPWFEYDAPKHT